jgi:hypothetical protein
MTFFRSSLNYLIKRRNIICLSGISMLISLIGLQGQESTDLIQSPKHKISEHGISTLTDNYLSSLVLIEDAGSIKGRIIDSKTNLPVCYADIFCNEDNIFSKSNSEGEFLFSMVKFPARLKIRKFGYEQMSVIVNSPEGSIQISMVPFEFKKKFESNKIKLQCPTLLKKAIEKLRLNTGISNPDPLKKDIVYCRISVSIDSVTDSFFESYAHMNIPHYSLKGYKSDVARFVSTGKIIPGISPNKLEYSIDPLIKIPSLTVIWQYINKMRVFEQDGNRIVLIGLTLGETQTDYYLNMADTSLVYVKSSREQHKKYKLPMSVKTWKDDLKVKTEISFSPYIENIGSHQIDCVNEKETYRLIREKKPDQIISKSTLFIPIPDSSQIINAVKDYVFKETLNKSKLQINYSGTYVRSKKIPFFESEIQKLFSKSYNQIFWAQNTIMKPNSEELGQIKLWENNNRFYAENNSGPEILIEADSMFNEMNRSIIPVENVFLELDRSYYLAGDTIWFSAFIPRNTFMDSASLSKILYVDLINAGNKLEKRLKLLIKNGRAHGDIELNKELKNGIFAIRAYTQWMRNFQKDYFFEKRIPVYQSEIKNLIAINPLIIKSIEGDSVNLFLQVLLPPGHKTLDKLLDVNIRLNDSMSVKRSFNFKDDFRGSMGFFVPDSISCSFADLKLILSDTSFISEERISLPLDAGINIQFFPESGKLVDGIETVIAYKAFDNKGNPSEFEADIVDGFLNTMTHIAGNKSGIGKFNFIPRFNKTYKALVTRSGNKYAFELPVVEPEGYIINYNSDSSAIYIKNNQSTDKRRHYVSVSVRGVVYTAIEIILDTNVVHFHLPHKWYPKGIVQITLFDSLYHPLAERLIFNNRPDQKMLIQAETDKKEYLPGEKVSLTINVSDYAGNPVVSSLSMSVVDALKTDTLISSPDIESYLYLLSELKGEIDYSLINLADTTPSGKQNIDLVMMTQGWRNYLWNSIRYRNSINELYPVEKGFYIDGRVSGYNKRIAVSNYRLNVFDPLTGFNEVINVDEKGKFKIDIPFFFDTHHLFIQNRINKKRIDEIRFTIDTFPFPEIIFHNNELPYYSYKPGYLKTIEEKNAEIDLAYDPNIKYIMIPEVIVKAKSRPYYSKPEITVSLDKQDPTGTKYSSIMQMITGEFGEKAFLTSTGQSGSPILVYNGMVVHPWEDLYGWAAGQPVNEVSDVKFYDADNKLSQFYSKVPPPGTEDRGTLAVVSFTTYSNYYRGNPKGAIVIPFQGIYQAKEFYKPEYELNRSGKIDNRTTIYWNPEIETDSTGRAHVSFYNSDIEGIVIIRISGVSYHLKDASTAVSRYMSY